MSHEMPFHVGDGESLAGTDVRKGLVESLKTYGADSPPLKKIGI